MKIPNWIKFFFKNTPVPQTLSDKQKAFLDILDASLTNISDDTVPPAFMNLLYVSITLEEVMRGPEYVLGSLTNQLQHYLVNDKLPGLYMGRSIAFLNTNGDWQIIIGIRSPIDQNLSVASIALFLAAAAQTDDARLQVVSE